MPIREILKHPHEMLRRKARPVEQFDAELQRLIDDMVETMRAAPGVGLAATQVSVPLRVIVVEYAEQEEEEVPIDEMPKKKLYTLINPELSRASIERETAGEGCLSIPGLVGDVDRSTEVTIKGLNRRGQPTKIKTNGWLARIFQHEIDHLNGVLFIDRAEKVYQLQEEDSQAATRA